MSNLKAAGNAGSWPVELAAGNAASVHPGRRIVELISGCTPFWVPVDNPTALGAYYAGVLSLVPLAGPLVAGGALHWGSRALVAARDGRGGTGHAWTGMLLAGVSLAVHTVAALWLVLATV